MSKIKSFAVLNAAALLTAVGIYFFKYPNNFCTGGVSGITVILGHYMPWLSLGVINWGINLALLTLGIAALGKSFGLSTAYVTLSMSAFLDILERLFPLSAPLTDQPFLELLFGILLPAAGTALLFNEGASTGGTDIIAMIVKKYSRFDTGSALFAADALVAVLAFFAFDARTALFSLFGLVAKSVVVNRILRLMNTNKSFTIITGNAPPIIDFIKNRLHRGATVQNARGMFEQTDKVMIITAVSPSQAHSLEQHIKTSDPRAFVMVNDICKIIGKGFRGGI